MVAEFPILSLERNARGLGEEVPRSGRVIGHRTLVRFPCLGLCARYAQRMAGERLAPRSQPDRAIDLRPFLFGEIAVDDVASPRSQRIEAKVREHDAAIACDR